jgi:hypothetical protein
MTHYYSIVLLCFCFSCFSQQQDSIVTIDSTTKNAEKKTIYSKARKAAIFSACLPGLGQAYNKKYWKIPIIYSGIGGFGYLFYINNTKYNNYRQALIKSQDTATNKGYAIIDGINYSTSQLQTQKLYYKKFRDFGVIGIAIIYLLNIVDANVDGHLQTFDVSDDLSLRINPWQNTISIGNLKNKTVYGLSIKLNFR